MVVLIASPFGIRAEQDASIRDCKTKCFKNLCVKNILGANKLRVCDGSIINGGQVINAASTTNCCSTRSTTCANGPCVNGCALVVNGQSVFNGFVKMNCGEDVIGGLTVDTETVTGNLTVDGCLITPCINITGATGACLTTPCLHVTGDETVDGSPAVGVTGATGATGSTGNTGSTGSTGATGSGVPAAQVHQFYSYLINPTQFSGVSANTTNVVVFQTYQTINWGTFSTNTLYLSMVVSGADDGNPINFTLELGNGPTPITNPFVDFANFGPIYSAVEWNQGAAASNPAIGNWSSATEFNIIIQGGYPVGQTSCNICCFVLTWTS